MHGSQEHVDAERLVDEMTYATGFRHRLVLVGGKAAGADGGQTGPQLAERRDGFVAVHLRHAHVDDGEVHARRRRRPARSGSLGSRFRSVVTRNPVYFRAWCA